MRVEGPLALGFCPEDIVHHSNLNVFPTLQKIFLSDLPLAACSSDPILSGQPRRAIPTHLMDNVFQVS